MTSRSETQEHDEHPGRANNQAFAATVRLDEVDTERCDTEIDAVEDHLRHEGVVDASRLEDDSAIVEELHD